MSNNWRYDLDLMGSLYVVSSRLGLRAYTTEKLPYPFLMSHFWVWDFYSQRTCVKKSNATTVPYRTVHQNIISNIKNVLFFFLFRLRGFWLNYIHISGSRVLHCSSTRRSIIEPRESLGKWSIRWDVAVIPSRWGAEEDSVHEVLNIRATKLSEKKGSLVTHVCTIKMRQDTYYPLISQWLLFRMATPTCSPTPSHL